MLQKVMMYPDPDNLLDLGHYIVIDYLRQEIPLRSREVIIPFFSEKGEMVFKEMMVGSLGVAIFKM